VKLARLQLLMMKKSYRGKSLRTGASFTLMKFSKHTKNFSSQAGRNFQ